MSSFLPQVENKLKQFESNLKTDFSFPSIPKFSENELENCVGAFDTWSYSANSPISIFPIWQIQLPSMSNVEESGNINMNVYQSIRTYISPSPDGLIDFNFFRK